MFPARPRFLGAADRVAARAGSAVSHAPAPPPLLREAARRSRALEVLDTASWAESAIRSFAGRTNLSVAATPVLVLGDGPIASALTRQLSRSGARVRVAGGDAVARLAITLSEGIVGHAGSAVPADVAVVFASGEGTQPLTATDIVAGERPLVAVDASRDGSAIALDLAGSGPRSGIGAARADREVFVLRTAAERDSAVDDAHADALAALALALSLAASDDELAGVVTLSDASIAAADALVAEAVLS